MAASTKEDHRYADSLVGIDLGKTTFHLVALGAASRVLVKEKFTQRHLTSTANMQTSLIGFGGLLGCALSRTGITEAGS